MPERAITDMVNEYRIIQVDDINIGKNIRRFREAAAYRQVEMVTQLQLGRYDISVYSYNRNEKGTQNQAVSLLLILCSIHSCNMKDLSGIFRLVTSYNISQTIRYISSF